MELQNNAAAPVAPRTLAFGGMIAMAAAVCVASGLAEAVRLNGLPAAATETET